METESAYFDVGIQSIIFVARNTSFNEITNLEDCGSCPVFASYILAFALQLRKKHGKTSVRWPQLKKNPCRCEDNIKLYRKGVGWDDVDRLHLNVVRDKWRAVVNKVMNIQLP